MSSPELRFTRDDGAEYPDWQERKLGDVFEDIRDKVGQQDIPTYSISAGTGLVSQTKKFGKDISGQQNERYTVLCEGEFAYNKGNSKSYKYGCIYPNDTGKKIAVPNVFISFRRREYSTHIGFYAKLFENHHLDRGLRRVISSGARMDGLLNMNKNYFFDLKIPVPHPDEQRKIADFLSALDARITLLTEKKTALAAYKRGMMQRLFSRALRFSRDDGTAFPDWQERTLGEVAEFFKGKGISKADTAENGRTPCIRYGQIYTIYRERIQNVASSTDVNSDGLFLSQQGDVIIPASGEDRLDMARACCVENAGVALGGDINILRSLINGDFLAYYLNNARKKDIARLGQGISVVHLYPAQLKTLSVEIPHSEEQRKIADFLSALDARIDAVSALVSKMETFRKGLLQKMFV